MKIIDTHLHIWDMDQFSLPWLMEEGPVLKRNYNISDYKEQSKSCSYEIEKAVYVEVDTADFEKERENAFIISQCQSPSSLIQGAVISGDLRKVEFKGYIDAYKTVREIKGVRQVLHVPSMPPKTCLQKNFIENIRFLGELGLVFDGCVRNEELGHLYELAKQCPETLIVVDHMGLVNPDIISKQNLSEDEVTYVMNWKNNLSNLASLNNVVCKISGLNPAGEFDKATLAPAVNIALDLFGEDKVMFASNYPVCNISTGLHPWITALIEITKDRSEIFIKKLFYENAKRVYQL